MGGVLYTQTSLGPKQNSINNTITDTVTLAGRSGLPCVVYHIFRLLYMRALWTLYLITSFRNSTLHTKFDPIYLKWKWEQVLKKENWGQLMR